MLYVHIVQIQTEVRDPIAVHSACRRLGSRARVRYSQTLRDRGCRTPRSAPDWLYPCVCDTSAGTVKFDNFGGPGANSNTSIVSSGVRRGEGEARSPQEGLHHDRADLTDGSIKLTIQVGGAA